MLLLEKIRRRYQKLRTDTVIKQISRTPPVEYEQSDSLVIVSQVHHSAVHMAILAIKSFMSNLGRGRIELLDDGSLTEQDKDLLAHHLPGVTILNIRDVDLGKCPAGGTWERLVHILRLSQDAYVIQVDSDTLTIGNIDDLDTAIKNNQPFVITEPNWHQPVSTEYMREYWRSRSCAHVQALSEQNLHKIHSIPLKTYVHGCSAFTGFPKGGVTFEQLEQFSTEMESYLGPEKWREWGSEQLSSNVMQSLCPDLVILPWPKYLNYGFPFKNGRRDNIHDYLGQTSVLHFIGTNRYVNLVYMRLSKQIIGELN